MATIDIHGRSLEERQELRRQIEEANREAEERWNDPQWRAEMAAAMTETIYEGFEHENLLSLMADVENVGFSDRVFVKEVRGLRAHWVARGGQIEASTMRAQVAEMPRDTIGFHVYEFEDKIQTNWAETQADLVRLGIERLTAEVNVRVLKLFQAALPNPGDNATAASGVSLTAVNNAIRKVRDKSRSTAPLTIIGRETMTGQLVDEIMGTNSNGSGFLPETNERLLQQGVLGTYRGARIITLTNYLDDMDVSFFPANEMFVLGRDASKFAFFGGMKAKEWSEQGGWYWHYLARRDFGGMVHRPERAHRIIDNSLSA